MDPIAFFRGGAFTFGLIAMFVGLTQQAVRNYRQGESRMPLSLNGPMMVASFCRGAFFFLSGEYLLMGLDCYGFTLSTVLTLQGFGLLVRPKTGG